MRGVGVMDSTPPLWVEIRVRIPWRPLGDPLSDTVCGFLFAVLAQWSVLQSSKLMMRVRFPYTARYDSMPVGSSRRAVMTMRVVSDGPRLRLFGGHADHRRRPSSYEWMMRTALCRKGWCESDKAYPPSAGKVSWNAGDRVFLSAEPQDVETVSRSMGFQPP